MMLGFIGSAGIILGILALYTSLRAEVIRRRRVVFFIIFFIGFLLTLYGGIIVVFNAYLKHWQILSSETFIARIKTINSPDGIILSYQPKDTKRAMVYTLKGKKWGIRGKIIKWKGWMNYLGARTIYRIEWIEGLEEKEMRDINSIYRINTDRFDLIWDWIMRRARIFPFIEASYENEVFQYPGKNWLLYAGINGFTLKLE